MSRRHEKINKHIQRILGKILQEEVELPSGVLVTVSQVEAADNLRTAKAWLAVIPDQAEGKVLRKINKQVYELQGLFNQEINMHPLPRLSFLIDHGAKHAEKIERVLRELE